MPPGNPVHLLYPLLARIRHANDARGPQLSGPHQISTAQGEHSETNSGGTARDGSPFPVNAVPPVPGLSPAANGSTGRSSQDSGSGNRATNGANGDTGSREAARVDNEQGQLFANMLRLIMPLISEAARTERGNSIGSSSSRRPHDPPEAPSPKRRKSEEK